MQCNDLVMAKYITLIWQRLYWS